MQHALAKRLVDGSYRQLKIKTGLVDFCSNDYLGLARSLNRAFAFGGSTGSRLLSGNSSYAEELESFIASYHGFESALLFSSGFLANLGLFSCLPKENETIFYDTQVHASSHDGIKLAKCQKKPFKHSSVFHLEMLLKRCKETKYIAIESIYSADGTIAPLEEINRLALKYGARLIIDEAHAVGVFNQGLAFQKGIKPFALVVTFGKALGVQGAAVLGSNLLRNYLINFCRPFIYSTAPALSTLCAIRASYETFPGISKEHLFRLIERMGLTSTPIQFFPVKGREKAKKISSFLEQKGFDVRPIFSPTVPQSKEGLRISLHSYNTLEEVDRLKALLEEACAELS
jgi:8-amino-7-oxononanoate synthase